MHLLMIHRYRVKNGSNTPILKIVAGTSAYCMGWGCADGANFRIMSPDGKTKLGTINRQRKYQSGVRQSCQGSGITKLKPQILKQFFEYYFE